MSLMINESCVSCGACEAGCPNSAISEGDTLFIIDPARCTECVGFHDEPQCALTCPTEACVPDPRHVESRDQLLQKKNRQTHP